MNKNILEKKANKKQLIILFIIVAAIARRLFQVLCKHKKLI